MRSQMDKRRMLITLCLSWPNVVNYSISSICRDHSLSLLLDTTSINFFKDLIIATWMEWLIETSNQIIFYLMINSISKSLILDSLHLLKEEMETVYSLQNWELSIIWLQRFISDNPTKDELLIYSHLRSHCSSWLLVASPSFRLHQVINTTSA